MPEKSIVPELSRKDRLKMEAHELANRQYFLKLEIKHAEEERDAALARAKREVQKSIHYSGQLQGDLAAGVALVERDNIKAHERDIARAKENLALLQEAYGKYYDELHEDAHEDDLDRTEEVLNPESKVA